MRGKRMILVLAFPVMSMLFLPPAARGQEQKRPMPGEIKPAPAPLPSPQVEPLPSPTPTVQEPPRVTYFQINRGQESTISRTVTLNFTSERASQYRASERQDFAGAQWKYMTTPPTYTLSPGDGRKTVYLQVKGAMDRVSVVVSDSISLQMTPRVTSFSVDRWYSKVAGGDTYQGCKYDEKGINVTTKTTVSTRPTEFRIGVNPSFSNDPWKPWHPNAPLTDRNYTICIPRGTGTRTLYQQVKNSSGTSRVASAAFQIPQRKNFSADLLGRNMDFFKLQGFKFGLKPLDATSRCEYWEDDFHKGLGYGKYITVVIPAGITGSRCDVTHFDGRSMKEGWKFKAYDASDKCDPPGRNYSVNERPTVGGRQIRFRVHLWAESTKKCSWSLKRLNLEGPGDAHWKEAFE